MPLKRLLSTQPATFGSGRILPSLSASSDGRRACPSLSDDGTWPRGSIGHLGTAGAIGSVAVASVLQAVDGVALKVMVDHWAKATGNEKAILFQAAFAVRQVEIGLASFASILFGMTVAVYGVAVMIYRRYPMWLGGLGVVGGIAVFGAGVLMAHTGRRACFYLSGWLAWDFSCGRGHALAQLVPSERVTG